MAIMRPLFILPPQDYLRECFDYDAATGVLTWRQRPRHHFRTVRADSEHKRWNKRYAGTQAGCVHVDRKTGYRCLRTLINKGNFLTHRVIWKWMTGDDPPPELDHWDLDSLNNHWTNLRAATHAENCHNVRVRRINVLGAKGVRLISAKRYEARIRVKGKAISLGTFPDIAEAQAAYAEAARRHYGEYARIR